MKNKLLLFFVAFSFSVVFAQKNVAVIGAGMAGVSVAYHIKKEHPEAEVFVFEKAEIAGENA